MNVIREWMFRIANAYEKLDKIQFSDFGLVPWGASKREMPHGETVLSLVACFVKLFTTIPLKGDQIISFTFYILSRKQ